MSQQSRNMMIVLAGAAIGGVAGYLFLTPNGRRLRARLEPAIDDLVREMRQLGGTVSTARSVVTDGLRALNHLTPDAERPSTWSTPLRQQDPF